MGSLLFKWILLGTSVAAMNKVKRATEAPLKMKAQAAGVARKGVIAVAGLMVAATILSAGVIIAINNWFLVYQNTGSFSMQATVWGGIVLALIGGIALYMAWPKESKNENEVEEPEKSDLEKTIIMALRGYIEDKQLQRELRRQQKKTYIRSVK